MRCFVALPAPEPVREHAAGVITQLKSGGGGVKWVEPNNLHLTLKFLGEVDESLLPELEAALDAACAGAAPLRLAIGLPGSFPNRGRPRVVWLGLEGEVQRLVHLAGAIEQAFAPLGFEPEGRPFKAHLTLGRVRQPRKKGPKPDTARLSRDLAGYQGAPGPEFSADRVVLMQSTLTPRGPIYQPLHQVLLAGG